MRFYKIILIIFPYFYFSNFLYANIENKIVVKIGKEIITEFEIKNKILSSLILSNQNITQQNINKIKKQTLNSLILHKIKKIELSKHDFKNSQQEVNLYLNQITSNNISELKNKFEDYGIDYDLFLEETKVQLKWQKFIYNFYEKKIEINENDIKKEIEKILEKQKEIEEYNIYEIEILINNNEKDKILISDLSDQIKSLGFEDAAQKFSVSSSNVNKGNLGWVNSKSLSKPIHKIISQLKIGSISGPIKRQNSVLFLKLADKRKVNFKELNLEDTKIKLINQKKNDLFKLYSSSHLSKLKNSTFIEYQ